MSLLKKRLISAAIIISLTLTFVAMDAWMNFGCPGLWMLPVGIYLIWGSALECSTMLGRSFGKMTWPTMLGTTGVMIAGSIPMLWPLSGSEYPTDCPLGSLGLPLVAAVISQLACFAWYFSGFVANSGAFHRASLAGWVSSYFGICFAFALALRMIGNSGWGLFLIVGVILVTKSSDAGAYFTGKLFGRTKLCPAVSPNKTYEGLAGGMLIACLAAAAYFVLVGRAIFSEAVQVHWLGILTLGVGLTLAGLVGDLLESVFKRETGNKDSGNLLPGLGGLWDVTDSLLPAFVVGYLLLQTQWIRGPLQ